MGIFSISGQPVNNNGFDNFQDQSRIANIGGPGWEVDRSDLTPSYAAGYRPHGYEDPITSRNPGFWASAHNQFNPFAANATKFSDPFAFSQPFREGLAPRVGDAGIFAAQVGVGVGAFAAGNALWKSFNYAGIAGGSSAGWMKGRAAQAVGRFAGGMAKGVMGSRFLAGSPFIGAGTVKGAITAGRVAGGIAGGLVGMGIAQMGIDAFNGAITDPYMNQRRTARDFRENFSGVTFGENFGDPYHGRGLSFSASNQMAAGVTRDGFSNQAFTGAEIKGIADRSSRMGMLDNIDPSKFAQQIKAITKQTALVASIANFVNDPENIESLKVIAKFKESGISINDAAKAFATMAGHSSVAGISSSRMMDMSTQGQFLFSANGMTPGEGINRYSSSYASFAAAKRNGLISDSLMARLGEEAGATQASLTGMIKASQTPYNSMLMANRYLGNGTTSSGSISNDLSRFGGLFGKNPIDTMGAMGMYGGAMATSQLKDQGPLAMQAQIMAIARSMPGMLNKNGTLDIHKGHLIATQMLNIGSDEATASLMELMNAGDPKQYASTLAGINSSYAKNRATLMEAEGISGLRPWVQAKNQLFKPIGRAAQQIGQELVSPLTDGLSSVADYLSSRVDYINYGETGVEDREAQGASELRGNAYSSKRNKYNTLSNSNSFWGSDNEKVGSFIGKINESARKGDDLSAKFTLAKTADERDAIIKEMRKQKHSAIEDISSATIADIEDQYASGQLKAEYIDPAKDSKKVNRYSRYLEEMEKRKVSYSDILAYNDKDTPEAVRGRIEKRWTEKDGIVFGSTNYNRSLTGSAYGIAKELKAKYDRAKAEGYTGSFDQYSKDHRDEFSGKYAQSSFGGDERADAVGATAETAEKLQALSNARSEMIAKLNKARSENKITGGDYFAKMAMASADKMNEAADKMLEAAGMQGKEANKNPQERFTLSRFPDLPTGKRVESNIRNVGNPG